MAVPWSARSPSDERIGKLSAEQPRSAYEIAQSIWGRCRHQAFLTLPEVIGDADLLVNEGPVRQVDDDDVIRYEQSK